MKLKNFISAFTALIILFASTALSACRETPLQSYVQQLDYTESIEQINNPDQGFYRPISVKVTESGVTYNQNIINAATRLYHLRIDISAFSEAVNGSDKQLTQAALDGLEALLSYLKEQDKNAVVRFAYDPAYSGNKNTEPSVQMILKHIEQVSPILNGYQNTVTAIEAGLIGPWGEMHSSTIATVENFNSIIRCFLQNTQNIPVLVRTPKMIYDYLGITVNEIDGYTVSATQDAYRLGLFNDGYLGSESDLGTYTDRQRDTEFLSRQNEHLPYGGEVVIPSSNLHDIENCLPEMHKLSLSYLNVQWNDQVIAKWKNSLYTEACGTDEHYYGSTAFDYIQNHLGYRFVLTNSTFRYSEKFDKLEIELTLQNVGFGNLNKTKHAKIMFIDEQGEVALCKDVADFTGETTCNYSLDLDLESGKYDVYLRVYGEEAEQPLYCLQFANNALWNAALKANQIGSLEVI